MEKDSLESSATEEILKGHALKLLENGISSLKFFMCVYISFIVDISWINLWGKSLLILFQMNLIETLLFYAKVDG